MRHYLDHHRETGALAKYPKGKGRKQLPAWVHAKSRSMREMYPSRAGMDAISAGAMAKSPFAGTSPVQGNVAKLQCVL